MRESGITEVDAQGQQMLKCSFENFDLDRRLYQVSSKKRCVTAVERRTRVLEDEKHTQPPANGSGRRRVNQCIYLRDYAKSQDLNPDLLPRCLPLRVVIVL